MFWKYSTLILLIVLTAAMGYTLAQSEATEPIQPCTTEQADSIYSLVDLEMSQLVAFLSRDHDSLLEQIDDITIQQRRLSYSLTEMPHCADTYTIAYPMQFVLDEFAIAYGLRIAANVADDAGDERKADRLTAQIDKHLREALRTIRRVFPQAYEEHFSENTLL